MTGQFPRTRTTEGLGALTEVEVPGPTASLPGNQRAFRSKSGCGIIVGLEPAKAAPARIWVPPAALELWHLSISHPHRLPTWDEVADARYELVPDDVTMALLLPPSRKYLNVHETTLHLWQIEDRRVEDA